MYRSAGEGHRRLGKAADGAYSSRILYGLTGLLVALGCSHAGAQEYPVKPIRIIAGSAAGGPIDITARLVAKQLTVSLHQQAVVENRPGAGGTIGAEYVAKSPADGYTLLMGSAAAYGVLAPAGTPRDIVMKLHDAIVKSLGTTQMRIRCAPWGWWRSEIRPTNSPSSSEPNCPSGRRSSRRPVRPPTEHAPHLLMSHHGATCPCLVGRRGATFVALSG